MYKGWVIGVGGFEPQIIVRQRKKFDNEVNRDRVSTATPAKRSNSRAASVGRPEMTGTTWKDK